MAKIFILMGKSSSGKDSFYKKLIEDKELMLKQVVMYTTRPIRANEEDGVNYHFVDDSVLKAFINNDRLIELREYNTVHGVWKYFTPDDGQIKMDEGNYIVIGTLDVYNKFKAYYGSEVLVPIYIEVDDGIRLLRAVERERQQSNPKYAELCRRFLADSVDFSEEKLMEAGIKKRYVNDDFDRCYQEIVADIKYNML